MVFSRFGSGRQSWQLQASKASFLVASESDVRQWYRGFGSAVGTGMPWCFPVSEAAAKAGSCRLQRLVFGLQFFLVFFSRFFWGFFPFLGFDGFDWYLQRFAAKLSDLHGVVVVVVGWMVGWLVGAVSFVLLLALMIYVCLCANNFERRFFSPQCWYESGCIASK